MRHANKLNKKTSNGKKKSGRLKKKTSMELPILPLSFFRASAHLARKKTRRVTQLLELENDTERAGFASCKRLDPVRNRYITSELQVKHAPTMHVVAHFSPRELITTRVGCTVTQSPRTSRPKWTTSHTLRATKSATGANQGTAAYSVSCKTTTTGTTTGMCSYFPKVDSIMISDKLTLKTFYFPTLLILFVSRLAFTYAPNHLHLKNRTKRSPPSLHALFPISHVQGGASNSRHSLSLFVFYPIASECFMSRSESSLGEQWVDGGITMILVSVCVCVLLCVFSSSPQTFRASRWPSARWAASLPLR